MKLRERLVLIMLCLLVLAGCGKSEKEIYGMEIEKLEEYAKEVAKTPVTEEQKRILDENESQNLEVGSFVDNMPDRKALEKANKDFICVLYGKYPDGSETIHSEYNNEYAGNVPYARDYYITDGINGEFWCVGYIIVEIKYKERDGKTYKMVQIPETFGSTKMIWYNTGEVKNE